MIYILPAPAKTLGMPARPSEKSANKKSSRKFMNFENFIQVEFLIL
jgi:hypothetical protein